MRHLLLLTLAAGLLLQAADQLTVHKIQLHSSSGTINGKVVGVAVEPARVGIAHRRQRSVCVGRRWR